MANPLEKLLRAGEGRILRRLQGVVKATGALEEDYEQLTDDELRNETIELRARYEAGETLDQLMPEAFAAVREAAKRTLGQRPYDVQIMGGAALHLGNIAEMKTGEGKTLTAALPAYLNAIAGKGVHVITVNDFLASYQSELMGRVYRALGMTTGTVVSGRPPRSAVSSTRPTSATARTTSSASTTCATTWPGAKKTWCSAATSSRSSTRSTRSSSTRRAPR